MFGWISGSLAAAKGTARSAASARDEAAYQSQKLEDLWRSMQSQYCYLADPPILTYSPEAENERGDPCHGCGSRETIIHSGARKCAYCRSDR